MTDRPIRVLLVDDQELLRAGFRIILGVQPDIEIVGEASTGAEAIAQTAALEPDVVCMDVQMPGMDGLEATRRIVADPALTAAVLILTTFDRDDYLYDALAAGASGFLLKNSSPEELIAAVRVVAVGDALLSPAVTRRVIEGFASRGRAGGADAGGGAAAEPSGAEVLSSGTRSSDARSAGAGSSGAGSSGALSSGALSSDALSSGALSSGASAQTSVESSRSDGPSAAGGSMDVAGSAASVALASLTDREREVLHLVAQGMSNAEIAAELYVGEATVKSHVSKVLQKLALRDRIQAVIFAYEQNIAPQRP
ncbi:response regulator [Plantibacter sp. Mn2098]|uniref:response regulator n=1 Tax=Plantibacter sp. Mn2098 TaxID=3395266 RepID=UPI003BC61801